MHESTILLLPPPTCIDHTTAILLHDYCAMYDSPPTFLVYTIHHIIFLAMAILCKGQAATDPTLLYIQHIQYPAHLLFVHRAVEPNSLIAVLWHFSCLAN